MNRFSKSLAATFLSAAMLFTSAAQAMEIRQFDKMAIPDQSEYVGLLVQGAEQVLRDEGRADLAAQVDHLFTTTDPGDAHTIGSVEFELNLALARVADAKRAEKDPNAQRVEVEDAMAVTLQKNHIDLPDSFYNVNKDFKPKLPLQTKKDDKKKN
jgi:galactokinase